MSKLQQTGGKILTNVCIMRCMFENRYPIVKEYVCNSSAEIT